MTQRPVLSAGIIPVRRVGPATRFLILRCYAYWDFPKGETRPGESPLDTARRELVEETGLTELVFRWGHSFFETRPYGRGKVARYYLAEAPSGAVELAVNPQLGRPEHQEHRWVTYRAGRTLLNDRVREALDWARRRIACAPGPTTINRGERLTMPSEPESATPDALLTPAEARVLGCLMEKQRTTPEQYPLTLNGLVSACNQKSARHPVMSMTVGEVGHVVNQLRDRGLIHASFSGRTERYDHKMVGTFLLSREEQALLCALMLRGPQTLGELRVNTGRLAGFKDLEQVTETLERMIKRDRPLVLALPRQPGRREERYAHLLCGRPSAEELADAARPPAAEPSRDARIEALETEVAALRAEIDRLWSLSGLADRR